MNQYGEKKIPFLFIIDFEMKTPVVLPLSEIAREQFLYKVNGLKNYEKKVLTTPIKLKKRPIAFSTYQKAFQHVQQEIKHGNSYLLNLSFPSKIDAGFDLKTLFHLSKARYKLWFKDQFITFSPESFVQIREGKIFTFPMKGTIDADIPDAAAILLNDKKETAEHCTIVDLLRNDLNKVAKKVKVEKFRYIDKITTNEKSLLQVSSAISGELEKNYHQKIGDIIFSLLPAGSICGAPKQKTVEIIKAAENYERGYYSGIFGYFDGEVLDSGVMIRFIEKTEQGLVYKSGGGITASSNLEKEYQELIDKIYVPG